MIDIVEKGDNYSWARTSDLNLVICSDVVLLLLGKNQNNGDTAVCVASDNAEYVVGQYYDSVEYGVWRDFIGTDHITILWNMVCGEISSVLCV